MDSMSVNARACHAQRSANARSCYEAGAMAGDDRWEPACAKDQHAAGRREPARYSAGAFERAAAMFRGAGEIRRLRLLERLLPGEMCVTDLAASVGDPIAVVSQRLRLLKVNGLIATHRRGRRKYYRLADEHVSRMVANVLAHATESRQTTSRTQHDHE